MPHLKADPRLCSKLALDGGVPVRATMLPYGCPVIDETDIQGVVEILRGRWLTTGPSIAVFEQAFAEKVGARYAVAVSSGTAALHAAVFAAGINSDDEVIVTPMTFVASANCVRYQGARVLFADVCPDTLTLNPTCVEVAITPRTRAIVTVDYAGQPSDLDDLNTIARRHQLTIIEDASHALGATYRSRRVGTLAHLTTFSLHPVKLITSGEGGVVTTNNAELAERLRLFRNHCILGDCLQREQEHSWFYEVVDLGCNYRLTDFQCALAHSQLRRIEEWLASRRKIAARFTEAFSSMPELTLPAVRSDREHAWHLYVVQLNLNRLRVGRAEVFKALRAENIGVNVHYIPVPWHPYYQRLGYTKGQWPVTEGAYERVISLPLWPGMSDRDVEDVIEAVQKVVDHFRR